MTASSAGTEGHTAAKLSKAQPLPHPCIHQPMSSASAHTSPRTFGTRSAGSLRARYITLTGTAHCPVTAPGGSGSGQRVRGCMTGKHTKCLLILNQSGYFTKRNNSWVDLEAQSHGHEGKRRARETVFPGETQLVTQYQMVDPENIHTSQYHID